MRTTDERLTRHFAEQREVPVSGTGVEAVMEQGRRHGRNRTIAVAAGSLALVAVLAAGATALQRYLEDAGEQPQAVADSPAGGEDDAMAWTAVESGISWSNISLAGADTLYLVSTAPGVLGDGDPAAQQQAIYTSVDGEVWEATVLGSEMWVNDLTERDGTLYAIGTTPGTGPMAQAAVGVRDEEAGAWDVKPLPSDFKGIGPLPESGSSRWVSIAGDDTIVAAVSTTVWADFTPLLPDGAVGPTDGVVQTSEGVAVIDWLRYEMAMGECGGGLEGPGAGVTTTVVGPGDAALAAGAGDCEELMSGDPALNEDFVVHRATWAELGLEAAPSLVEMYVSADGETFDKVETDLPGGSVVSLFAAGDGFVALANQYPVQSAWYSADGRSWAELPGLPAMDALITAGSLDGRIVVAGNRSGLGPTVAAYDDPAAAPEVIDVAADIGGFGTEVYLPAGAVGNRAVALAVSDFDMAAGRDNINLITSTDLDTWKVTPAREMLGDMNAQAGEVMVSAGGIYAQLIASDPRADAPWRPLPLMAIAERD